MIRKIFHTGILSAALLTCAALACAIVVKSGPEKATAQSPTASFPSGASVSPHWAEVWLQISFSPGPGMIDTEMDATPFDIFVNTQMALMKSPMVLEGVVEMPIVARLPTIRKLTDPMQWIASRLKIESVGGRQSEIFTVSMSSTDSQEAEIIVNAVVDSYISHYQIDLIRRTQAMEKAYAEAKTRHETVVRQLQQRLPKEPTVEETQTPEFALLVAEVEREVRMIENLAERLSRLEWTRNSVSRVRILKKAGVSRQ